MRQTTLAASQADDVDGGQAHLCTTFGMLGRCQSRPTPSLAYWTAEGPSFPGLQTPQEQETCCRQAARPEPPPQSCSCCCLPSNLHAHKCRAEPSREASRSRGPRGKERSRAAAGHCLPAAAHCHPKGTRSFLPEATFSSPWRSPPGLPAPHSRAFCRENLGRCALDLHAPAGSKAPSGQPLKARYGGRSVDPQRSRLDCRVRLRNNPPT